MCEALGFADLYADPAYATNNDRVRARSTLLPALRERLTKWGADELAAIFEKNGLPFAPIRKPEELLDDPHLLATGTLADVRISDGPKAGQVAKTTLLPITMDGERLGVRADPPTMGAHTTDLLRGLGYADGDIDTLRKRRIVA
jgi:crotonobetainyl-CoA:carnitine CoA-transferase CaiB-like acyl-CoA transferase